MILLDVNVLIYAFREDSAHHAEAVLALRDFGRAGQPLAWHPSLFAAVTRICTNRAIYPDASTLEECLNYSEAFRALPAAVPLSESPDFWETFSMLLKTYNVTGRALSDYYWAALAIDQGATLCSADQKFGQIRELRWHNLLG